MKKKIDTFPRQEELELVRQRLKKMPASQGLPSNASAADRIKYQLCERFVLYRNESGIGQVEIAKKLKISESVVSRILHYHIEDFTIDRLVNYLAKLGWNLVLRP